MTISFLPSAYLPHFSLNLETGVLQTTNSGIKKQKPPARGGGPYKIMAINPPDPSLIILSSVSFNL